MRSCTGWEWSTCKVVHDPLHRCIPGGLGGALGINAKSSALVVQVVRLVKLRMGRQRGGQACAARPCWRRSRRACLSFNNLHEHLFRGETAFGVGFRAAYGSTRFNRLPGFCKPGSVPPAAPRISILCRLCRVTPPLSNTGGETPQITINSPYRVQHPCCISAPFVLKI